MTRRCQPYASNCWRARSGQRYVATIPAPSHASGGAASRLVARAVVMTTTVDATTQMTRMMSEAGPPARPHSAGWNRSGIHVLYFAPSRIYAGFRSLPVLSLALDLTASWRRKRIGITGCQEEHPLFFRLMTAF